MDPLRRSGQAVGDGAKPGLDSRRWDGEEIRAAVASTNHEVAQVTWAAHIATDIRRGAVGTEENAISRPSNRRFQFRCAGSTAAEFDELDHVDRKDAVSLLEQSLDRSAAGRTRLRCVEFGYVGRHQ